VTKGDRRLLLTMNQTPMFESLATHFNNSPISGLNIISESTNFLFAAHIFELNILLFWYKVLFLRQIVFLHNKAEEEPG
jgi:hypothetical protein